MEGGTEAKPDYVIFSEHSSNGEIVILTRCLS